MSPQPLEGIAIIGMAGRFPGAGNLAEFWRNLIAGAETHSAIPEVEPGSGDGVPRRGRLDRPEWFDAAFFDMPLHEAEATDPQQRVFLEECWVALEDAGCDPARFDGTIGVFAGMSDNTYWQNNVAHHPELIESVGRTIAMMGNEKDYLAPRVAYQLNLRGPVMNINTAGSSSLVAVCQAVQGLLHHSCDVALAGGVSINLREERESVCEEASAPALNDHGTAVSDGVGVVVLKRLADAVANGDPIYAVIKGAAVNNDGSSKPAFTAPGADGRSGVIALALAQAGIAPRSIGYLEANGTGDPLEDAAEIAGLTGVFRAGTPDQGFCALGSVKASIGHAGAAAGIAGLIKAALILQHRKIPPHLQRAVPNSQLSAESPFFVPTRLLDWQESPRRCGVSSFGLGGTNAHVVLEEVPGSVRACYKTHERTLTPGSRSDGPHLLVVSAKTESALAQRASDLADYLETCPDLSLANVVWTLQTGRAAFTHRRAIVAASREIAISALRGFEPKRTFCGTPGMPGKVVFMFPGQGAEYAGMGAQLYALEPVFRAAFDECSDSLKAEFGFALSTLLLPKIENEQDSRVMLRDARHTEAAIFAVSHALARLWISWGIQPAACIGHGVGEFVAATLAGVFSLPDALRLVAARARLVSAQPSGASLAVRLSEEEVKWYLTEQITLAAVNGPKLTVLAGDDAALAVIEAQLASDGVATKWLEISHAAHSPMMESVAGPLTELLESLERRPPAMPILSTTTADWLTNEQIADPNYWAHHLRATVRFSPAMAKLLADESAAFVECGPGQALLQMVRQQSAGRVVITSLREGADERPTLLAGLAQLWTLGAAVKWDALAVQGVHRVSLPTYPFDRQRCLAEPRSQTSEHAGASSGNVRDELGGITAAAPEPMISREPQSFPLTVWQQQIHSIARLSADASTAFHESIRLRICGALEVVALKQAMERLFARHETLRTTFAADGSLRTVHPAVEHSWRVEDLAILTPAAQAMTLSQFLAEDAQTPFDLERGPLLRPVLFQLGSDAHELILTAHQIVGEDCSLATAGAELCALYTAIAQNSTPALPPVVSKQQVEHGQEAGVELVLAAEMEAWWQAQFTPAPPPLLLPTERPLPTRRTFDAATCSIELPGELCQALQSLATSAGSTIAAVLLGGFFTLLHRLSGQSDLVIRTILTAQPAAGTPMDGHAAAILPLRLPIDEAEPFVELLARLTELIIEAQARQATAPHVQSEVPSVCAGFTQHLFSGTLDFAGARAEVLPIAKQQHHLDLDLDFLESGGVGRVLCHFNRDRFTPEIIERWLAHYMTLLSAIASEPATALNDLPMLSAEQAAQILVEWNARQTDYPREAGLDDLFEQVAELQPEAIAITDAGRAFNYGQLNTLANALAHRLGLIPGALVGVCLERSAEFVIVVLAVMKAGCTCVPLDPSWPAERLQGLARYTQFAHVVTVLAHARHFATQTTLLDGPRPIPAPDYSNPVAPTSGSIPAYVICTSGSPDIPKGIVIPHRAVTRLALDSDCLPLTSNDVVGHLANPAFDSAIFELWGTLLNGAHLVIVSEETLRTPDGLATTVRESGLTTLFVSTALFNRTAALTPDAFQPLRQLLIATEPCCALDVRQMLQGALPQRLLHVYGSIEAMVFATQLPANETPLSLGRPAANTEIYILDANMRPVPIGVPGELYLGGDGLALGYYAQPELTAGRFVEHPFDENARLYRTGDRARWLADGSIEFITPLDERLYLHGLRVDPHEIEAELARHPEVQEAAVRMVDDSTEGPFLAACFVPYDGHQPAPAELRAFLRRRLPHYLVPSAYIQLEALPLATDGGVAREALPLPGPADSPEHCEPRNPTEIRIAGLMAATLGQPRISIHDDFFQLGGDSLLAMDLIARLRKAFGIEVLSTQLLETPTTHTLAEAVALLVKTREIAIGNVPRAALRTLKFLVPIQRGSEQRAPLFLVAGGLGGDLEFRVYAQLAGDMDPEQTIYGLKARGTDTAESAHVTVAEMAADYLNEIRSVQPVGPYFLAGDGIGGICAHEMACQLRDAGEEVARLILLDTHVPTPGEWLARDESMRPAMEDKPTLGRRIRKHFGQISGLRGWFGKSARPVPASGGKASVPNGPAAYAQTLARHTLRQYPGCVTLLVDEESFDLYDLLGWDQAPIGDLETHILPGSRLSYIREHSHGAARKVQQILSERHAVHDSAIVRLVEGPREDLAAIR